MSKIKYLLVIVLVLCLTDISAQNSQVLYNMNLPQNHLLNPALRPSNKIFIGLPALSGINLNFNNNFVNFSDVIIKGQPGDSLTTILHPGYDIDKFLAKIKNRNFMESESVIPLLEIGFSAGDSYIFLDINDRFNSNTVIPGDLFKLAFKGNGAFAGGRIDLSSLRGDMKYYHEIGLGFSRNFTDRLRIGIKGKFLMGVGAASINNQSLGITIDNDYSHTFDANLQANISGPVNVYMNSKNNIDSIKIDVNKMKTVGFWSGRKNSGFSIDIGATFDLTDKVTLSAAITDVGFIRWKKDITNLSADNQFTFSGLSLSDFFNGSKTIDEIGKDMVDSLKNAFVLSKSKNPFTTYLPVGVTFGGTYSVTKSFSLGLLSYTRIISKQMREAVTLSANMNLGNALSTSICYTAANGIYDNLGAGLAFRAGIAQFYLVSDRIPVSWNKLKDKKSTIIIPSNWNTVNLRLGMNLVFGNRVKEKKDKPMIVVE